MNTELSLPPYELLQNIQARSQAKAFGLPQKTEVRRTWSGIGFRFGGHHLVVPLGEVAEILEYPDLTRVPNAKPWVLGIANIRGSLLPVLDLKGFVEGSNTKLSRISRVLVTHQENISSGVMIDEVLGMRHFFEEEKLQDVSEFADTLKPFLDDGYKQGEQNWGVFSMRKLILSPKFMEVAGRG
ncbi:MAG: chemotaxis protein CheW [Proteobacteria bacterium]|jgi:twitching motility protein PilI|nr:chemotaxis protein CheW [Pseudomonadota bacterium]